MDSTLSPSQLVKCFLILTVLSVGWYALYVNGKIGSWQPAIWMQGNWQSFKWRIPIQEMTEGSEIRRRLRESNETKIILVWHRPSWMKDWPKVWHPDCGKCDVTVNKSMINNTATKAVVFYYSGVSEKSMPSPQQRRSSDFLVSYSLSYQKVAAGRNKSGQDLLKMKTKGGVAIVSNCRKGAGPRMRMKILKKIQSLGFPLDGYGACFNSSGKVKRGWKAGLHTKQYKFYFSFENSYHCRDYITEKVFANGFAYAMAVPIVFGATKQDYESILPRGSFVFAEDFSSLENLVEYLQYLLKNDTAYLEYFRWHKTEQPLPKNSEPTGGRHAGFCQLCRALHGVNIDDRHDPEYNSSSPKRPLFSNGIAKRTMKSFHSYVFDEENKECNENNETNWKIYRDWKLDVCCSD